jgi:hypothetical protein
MLSITKQEAQKLRKNLLSMTAVRQSKDDNEYTIELMHENGTVYFLRRLDNYPYTTRQLDTAKCFADSLGLERFSVRLTNGVAAL